MRLASTRLGAFALLILVSQAFGGASYADKPFAEGSLVVNVNTGMFEELESIPGIGEAKAKEIFRERPYKKIEDLMRVKGINKNTLNSIRPYVTVEGKTRPR